ncbi:alginate export family protein [Aliikangiella coralliicola]|uniref:alginate export family protein n=1 Tax=Aliikangiella coralliicola TaxID=2592383 RepID=UPI00143D9B85|nr:alginate export family protein [Aliikangiella coralliicola]
MIVSNRFFNSLKFTALSLLFTGLINAKQIVAAAENLPDKIDDNNSTISALFSTEFEFGLRVRHEQVEQGNLSAHANTAKFRLHTKTRFNDNWRIEFELDHIEAYAEDHHSDGVLANGELVIADPEGTEINEAFLNANFDDLQIRAGRQKITFADERFVGSVGFRQNDQTFDALSLKSDLLTASQLDYAYIFNVNRIFGDDATARLSPTDSRFEALSGIRPAGLRGDHRVEGHLINFAIKEWDHLELNSYLYSVHNQTFSAFSNRSLGLRAEYRRKIARTRLFADIELAAQKQQESSVDDWIGYSLFEFGARYRSLQLSLRQERLNEKDGQAFITPLATLHKFQGWADQFLITPSVGLSDQVIRLQWKQRPITVDVRYHRYRSIKNSMLIGNETNVDFVYKANRQHEVKLRYADFEAAADQQIVLNSVKKMFLMYSYNL